MKVPVQTEITPKMNYPAAPGNGIRASLRQATGYQPEHLLAPQGRSSPPRLPGGLEKKASHLRMAGFIPHLKISSQAILQRGHHPLSSSLNLRCKDPKPHSRNFQNLLFPGVSLETFSVSFPGILLKYF